MTETDNRYLERRAAVKLLLENRGDALIVTGLGSPTYDVFNAGDSDTNFYLWGAMGGAALMGLGLALSQPDQSIVVITGDGEQLMGIGGLATIATQKPKSLTIIVLDNEHYGETGMQPSHTQHGIHLDRVADSMNFDQVCTLTSEQEVLDFGKTLSSPQDSLRLAVLKIAPDATVKALPPRDGVFLKNRFRNHLGFGVN